MDMEVDDEYIEVEENRDNPQMCLAYACDIYKHLRASEVLFLIEQNEKKADSGWHFSMLI